MLVSTFIVKIVNMMTINFNIEKKYFLDNFFEKKHMYLRAYMM